MFSSLISSLRRPAVWALACLSLIATQAIAQPTAINFGNVAVGASSGSQQVLVTFSQPGQIKAVKVELQGATGLDYSTSGGTCQPGSSYQAGQACIVAVSFKPIVPGVRNGAVVLTNPAGATIAIAYLTGIGQGALATFAAATPVLAVYDAGNGGWTVDGADNIYYLLTGSQSVIHKLTSTGGYAFATLPSQYLSPYLETIDGAGNLILTSQNRLIKVDPAGVVSLLTTIPPADPFLPPGQLSGIVALGNGDLKVGSAPQFAPGPGPGEIAPIYIVHPDGTYTSGGAISSPYSKIFVDALAVGPAGETYIGASGSAFTSSGGLLCQVPNEGGLALDASGTLLTGTQTNERSFIGPNTPNVCAQTVPPLNELPFASPVVNAKGDLYVVASTTNATLPVYKYIRTQLHGVVFASPGTATSYGSFAITNSGNQPLNLSKLSPTISGAQSTSFTMESTNCGQSLAPAATCTISLSYTPSGQYATLPASGSLLLGGLPDQRQIVPLNGFPNQ